MFVQGLNQPLLANLCERYVNGSPLRSGEQRLFQRGQASFFVLADQLRLPNLYIFFK